jgi:hypothetical protein
MPQPSHASDPAGIEPIERADWLRAVGAALLVIAVGVAMFLIHPAFFWKDDFQLQYLPGSREVARAWSAGTFPLLTQSSWFSGALAGEYQYGVFSVVRTLSDLLVWSLPLSLYGRAAMLVLLHAAIAAAGAFLLARSYGIRPSLSLVVAIVAPLNGWMLWWTTTWYPAIASFAWLPWYWLGLRAIIRGASRWSWVGVAFALYLGLSAGWPFTGAMLGVVAALNVVVALIYDRVRAAKWILGSSALGLGLAAPAVFSLLDYFRFTSREGAFARVESIWSVPPLGWLGLALPTFSTEWSMFAAQLPHGSAELAGALIPLAGFVAILRMDRFRFYRQRWPELILVLVLLLAISLPSAGAFRWSFRWLPLFHLGLALLGLYGLELVLRERKVLTAATTTAAVLGLTFLVAVVIDHDLRPTLILAGVLFVLCGLWFGLGRVRERRHLVLRHVRPGAGAGRPRASRRDADVPTLRAFSGMAVGTLASRRLARRRLAGAALAQTRPSQRSAARWSLGEAFPAIVTVATIFVTFLLYSGQGEVPSWRVPEAVLRAAPFEPGRLYLGMYEFSDLGAPSGGRLREGRGVALRPGNMPMLAGLHFVNGYSPLRPRVQERLLLLQTHGEMLRQSARKLLRDEIDAGGLMEQMGVDGLLVPRRLLARNAERLASRGWRAVGTVDQCTIFHRQQLSASAFTAGEVIELPDDEEVYKAIKTRKTSALPVMLLAPGQPRTVRRYAPRLLSGARQERLGSSVTVAPGSAAAMIVFRRPWLPGWRATLDGRSLPVVAAQMVMPAVVVPAGAGGRLEIRYRPWSLLLGASAAAVSLLVMIAMAFSLRKRV